MKGTLSIFGLLVLIALLISGCGADEDPSQAPPTATATLEPEKAQEPVELPNPLRARDAALLYLSQSYGERAPSLDQVWTEQNTTPQGL